MKTRPGRRGAGTEFLYHVRICPVQVRCDGNTLRNETQVACGACTAYQEKKKTKIEATDGR